MLCGHSMGASVAALLALAHIDDDECLAGLLQNTGVLYGRGTVRLA